MQTPRLLWEHPNPETTRTAEFKSYVEREYGVSLVDYEALRQWSIRNVNSFWQEVWHFTGIRSSTPFQKAVDDETTLWPRPEFFPGARLNIAQNLLYPSLDPPQDSLAVIEASETSRSHVTWRDLRERVRKCSTAMRAKSIKAGDRVVGYVANTCSALVAMLSAASVGAVWSAISPDTGVHAVLDRLQQIEPMLLFADNGVTYNGKTHQTVGKVKDIVAGLPQLKCCIVFETVSSAGIDISGISLPNVKAIWYSHFVQDVAEDVPLDFDQLPADHPTYILFSSGTTGKPKCMVHGAIGTLIQHKKEHDIQCSMRPGDRLLYFTTCTWMMWHWLVSSLATGVTLILYDGSPFRPFDEDGNGEMALPRLIEELRITHFGTSAKYLSILEQKDTIPKESLSLSSLKAIYSTGSPLAPSTFEYVYKRFGPNVNLASITGGTDIISLFGTPSQISPVYAGEIQVRGLGMAVEVWDTEGQDVSSRGEPGDLVCVKPFPCQPVQFWGSNGDSLYEKSYFKTFPGVWHHGDFVRINPTTGGLVMLGRSDGVLKPSGVRFGSSEIYNVLLQHFPAIDDSLCIGRRREHDLDETVVLFVKMAEGEAFSEELKQRIVKAIRTHLSARHVPRIIDETPEIPVTVNGKKVELAVKQILCGTNVKTSASVANAKCLEWYQTWNTSHSDYHPS